jgi:hypothetical protein
MLWLKPPAKVGYSLADFSETRIYSTAGQLVKALPYTAGETLQSVLPQGLYIVVVNGKAYKIEN